MDDMSHLQEPQPTTSELDTRLLSPVRVAERLDISRSQVYNLIDLGRLRTVRIGRSVRIPLRSIFEFVESLSVADSPIGRRDTPSSDCTSRRPRDG
jgi:excisionase family DNA binding protein